MLVVYTPIMDRKNQVDRVIGAYSTFGEESFVVIDHRLGAVSAFFESS